MIRINSMKFHHTNLLLQDKRMRLNFLDPAPEGLCLLQSLQSLRDPDKKEEGKADKLCNSNGKDIWIILKLKEKNKKKEEMRRLTEMWQDSILQQKQSKTKLQIIKMSITISIIRI